MPLIFGCHDYPNHVPSPGHFPLIINPIVGQARLTKVLMDGGSSLNILYASTLDGIGISRENLRPSTVPFLGIIPGVQAIPLGVFSSLSRLGIPPTSKRRFSTSRWLILPILTMLYWDGHVT